MIKEYLEWLSKPKNESVGGFAIDSFPETNKKKILRVPYPENIVSENYNPDENRIMIDLDKTIHKYSKGWQDGTLYDEPFEGVKEIIDQLKLEGYQVIILTTRLSETANGKEEVIKQKQMIEDWLKEYGIKVDGITAEKLPALLYIDDRGFMFEGEWNIDLLSKIKKELFKRSEQI